MTYPIFAKDPLAILDYKIDWSQWLPTGDTIATSTWQLPTGISLSTSTNTTTTTTAWLTGGTPGTSYMVTNKIVTAGGRTDERSLTIQVQFR